MDTRGPYELPDSYGHPWSILTRTRARYTYLSFMGFHPKPRKELRPLTQSVRMRARRNHDWLFRAWMAHRLFAFEDCRKKSADVNAAKVQRDHQRYPPALHLLLALFDPDGLRPDQTKLA